MKRVFLFLFCIAILANACSFYTNEIEKSFNKCEKMEGVTSFTLYGWMFKLLAIVGDMDKEEKQLLRSIDKVKIMNMENGEEYDKYKLNMEFYSVVKERENFEELMVINDYKEKITIYGRVGKQAINELYVLVGGEDDNVMLYVRGKLKPKLISNLIKYREKNKVLTFCIDRN